MSSRWVWILVAGLLAAVCWIKLRPLPPVPPSETASTRPSGPSVKVHLRHAPEPLPPPTIEHIDPTLPHFAYAREDGHSLMLLGGTAFDHPELMAFLALPEGGARRLSHQGYQEGDGHRYDRDTAWQAGKGPGTILQVEGAPLKSDDSYLVASEAFFATRKQIPFSRGGDPLPEAQVRKLEGLKGRAMRESSCIGRLGDFGSLYWAVFKPIEGRRGLACMVLVTTSAVSSRDFPGQGNDGQSWRVGDDGEPGGGGFRILYACQGAKGLEWAYAWGAEESEDISYAVQDGDRIDEIKAADIGRYWAPM